MKWAIELGEHDIRFKPKTAIKGQALADFVSELTPRVEGMSRAGRSEAWTLFVDGSSNVKGSGAGILLISPDGARIEYALHFSFKPSYNEVEYEAMILGLQLALKMQI